MKKTLLLTSVIMLLTVSVGFSQFVHVGVKSFMAFQHAMGYYEYETTDYVYYFANESNETIRFSGFESSVVTSFMPFPDIYIRYNLGNNLFFQLDYFALWFKNEASYNNSVDFSEYSETFNPNSAQENLGYNSIQLKWSFWGNSLTAGYIFMKTKALRPYIFGGFATFHLMALLQGDYYKDTRYHRNEIIFANLSTFKKITGHSHLGMGLQYHGFSIDLYYRWSNGKIDVYADKFGINDRNISLEERPNYEFFRSVNLAVSLNLFSFYTKKKKKK